MDGGRGKGREGGDVPDRGEEREDGSGVADEGEDGAEFAEHELFVPQVSTRILTRQEKNEETRTFRRAPRSAASLFTVKLADRKNARE